MYIDQILYIAGIAMFAITAILAVWLLARRKRGRELRRMLREDTERIDVMDTLRSVTEAKGPIPGAGKTDATEILSETEIGPANAASRTAGTERLLERGNGAPEEIQGAVRPGQDDTHVLDGRYELIREIHGGGMSRVYLGRNVKLENEWIVKYVSNKYALANEADVLKRLNHISLPQIVDIIPAKRGTFLVERFIEGYSLNEVMSLENRIKESQICDWGIQLARVLRYLHTLETPIIHCDLKPSNIMVTYDNRLVLIDFGISRLDGAGVVNGITPEYAAPEQFSDQVASSEIARRRFGSFPPEAVSWKVDVRTDIYSTGVILYRLITGKLPEAGSTGEIYDHAGRDFADVVLKCIETDPDKRFQTADELNDALEKVQQRKMSIPRVLLIQRIALICFVVTLLGGTVATASATYIGKLENEAIISMEPTVIAVTQQQGTTLKIQKTGGFGGDKMLTPGDLTWTFDDKNIASVDDDRLVGINVGDTVLHGEYRGKTVELRVKVTEPAVELTEVSLRYPEGTMTKVFAGDGRRESLDGELLTSSFVSPESMAIWEDGLYVSDSGSLRSVASDRVSGMTVEPFYLTVDKVRSGGGKTYILTGAWEDADENLYGIAEISGNEAKLVYVTQAAWSVTSDFLVDGEGMIWLVQSNLGTGVTGLYLLDPESREPEFQAELPEGSKCLAMDESGNIYVSVSEKGMIIRVPVGEKTWQYFAGVEGERNFIDGAVANFYEPTSLISYADRLYVLDFDTIRRITVENGAAAMTETVAGLPVANTDPPVELGAGEDCGDSCGRERSGVAQRPKEQCDL